ncbi:MAG: PD40 domain-containing protein [Spirochaetales bacterium]|nr:PD40 domain-containing protein [Spirochaetales bacterium]
MKKYLLILLTGTVLVSLFSSGKDDDLSGSQTRTEDAPPPPAEVRPVPAGPPEGEILFSSERGGDRDLYIVNADGTDLRVVLDLPSIEGHGDWAPDGDGIVFFSDRDGNRELYSISYADPEKSLRRLTVSPGNDHLPAWSPDGEKIAFVSERDGNPEIYIMNNDGTDQRRLTEDGRKDMAPTWSPDGKTLYFSTAGDNGTWQLRALDPSRPGSKPETLSEENIGYADVSPDGSKLAWHSNRSGAYGIYISGMDGSDILAVEGAPGQTDWIPVWSPDGRYLAFDGERGYSTGEIYVRDLEEGSLYRVTNHRSSDWGPDWRPVPPSKIIYDSNSGGDREIYIIDEKGRNRVQLTDNDWEDGLPGFSPDGRKIVFFSDRDGDDEIYIMNSDGTDPLRLTSNEAMDRAACWSPSGERIAFISDRDGNQEVYIMDRDGSNQTRLTENGARDFWPSWSPDGKTLAFTRYGGTQETWFIDFSEAGDPELPYLFLEDCSRCEFSPDGREVAFSSDRDGNWEIYTMNRDGTGLRRITRSGNADWVPTWSRDGKRLVFSSERNYSAKIMIFDREREEFSTVTPGRFQDWRPLFVPEI